MSSEKQGRDVSMDGDKFPPLSLYRGFSWLHAPFPHRGGQRGPDPPLSPVQEAWGSRASTVGPFPLGLLGGSHWAWSGCHICAGAERAPWAKRPAQPRPGCAICMGPAHTRHAAHSEAHSFPSLGQTCFFYQFRYPPAVP